MAETHTPRPAEGKDAGFFAHLREIFSSLADYLRARLQLAGLESKEAFVHYLKIVTWLLVAFFVSVFGYLFLCIGVVVLIAALLRVGWPWVMVVFALAHFGFAVVCVLIARGRLGQSMFAATLHEFSKDKEWLSSRP